MAVIASLVVRVSASLGELESAFEKLERNAAKVQKTYEKLGASLQSIGGKLTTSLTAPLVGLGAASVTAFAQFDTAMKGVEAALTPTAGELEALKAAAIEWGQKTRYSATKAATALGELGKAGFTANESIAALPSTLQLATVSGMNLAEAATLSADTIKQFNLEVSDAARVNDVLVTAAQKSTVDVQQLGQSLKYAGPVARSFGLSLEDTAAALGMFGNVGIKADMAGTSLKNVLTAIVNPMKGMRDTLKELNLATLESAPGIVKLTDVVQKLRDAGATNAQILRAFGEQAGGPMVALVSKGTVELKGLEAAMYSAAGAAEKAATTMQSGIGGALEQMKGAIETAGISLGEVLAPAVQKAAEKLGELAGWVSDTLVPAFKALPPSVQTGIGAFLGIAAAIGPVIYIAGTLVSSWGALAGAFGKFAGLARSVAGGLATITSAAGLEAIAASVAGAATAAFGTAMAILTSPVTLVVGAIVGLIAVLRYLTGSWEGVLKAITFGLVDFKTLAAAWEGIKTVAGLVIDRLGTLAETIRGTVLGAWAALTDTLASVADSGFGRLIGSIVRFGSTVADWAFVKAGEGAWLAFKAALEAVNGVVEHSNEIFAVLKLARLDPLSIAINAATGAWGLFGDKLSSSASPAIAAIEKQIKGLTTLLDYFAGRAAKILDTLAVAFETLKAPELPADPFKNLGAAAFGAGESIGSAAYAMNLMADPNYAKIVTAQAGALSEESKAAKKAREALNALKAEALGLNAIATASQWIEALKDLPPIAKLSADAQKKLNGVMADALDAFKTLGIQAPSAMRRVYEATLPPLAVNAGLRDLFVNVKAIRFEFDAWTSYTPKLSALSTVLAGMPTVPVPDESSTARWAALIDDVNTWAASTRDAFANVVGAFATGAASIGDIWQTLWHSMLGFAQQQIAKVVNGLLNGLVDGLTKGFKTATGSIDWGKLMQSNAGAAVVGAGVGAAVGYGVGSRYGKAKGALAGAGAGAAAGALYGSVVPGVGTAVGAGVGAVVGAFAGWMGGRKRDKEMRQAMEEDRASLLQAYGTMEKLRAEANRLGVDIDKAFSTKKPEEFGKILEQFSGKVEAENRKIEAITTGLSKLAETGGAVSAELMRNIAKAPPGAAESIFKFYESETKKTIDNLNAYLAAGLTKVRVKVKDEATGQETEVDRTALTSGAMRTQAGADALGASIAGVYADLKAQGLSSTEAFRELNPLITQYTEQVKLAGLTGSSAMAGLQTMATLAADAIAGPAMTAAEALGGALVSLHNTGGLTSETFKGLTGEIAANFKQIEALGVGGENAIASMQPALQKAWELQKDFGYETDESMRSVLEFAEKSGMVGDKFRPAADRMAAGIDKLVEKFDVFLSKLVTDAGTSGEKAASEIGKAFNFKLPPVRYGYEYDPSLGQRPPDTAPNVPAPPAPAYTGDDGGDSGAPSRAPSVVAPDVGVETTNNVYVDGELVARSVTRRQPGVLRGYGVR